MSDNRFAHCVTADQVLHSYAVMPDPEPGCAEALARIAELSRPVVDEAARERVAEVLRVEFGGPVEAWAGLGDRIIDALGYAAPEPTPVWPCGGTDECLCGTPRDIRNQPAPTACSNCDGRKCMDCCSRAIHDECVEDCPDCCTQGPESVTPATKLGSVDFAPDELIALAKVVEDYERLYMDAAKVVADDTMSPTLELVIDYGTLPVRVVCGENCWVLRIGGGDD